MHVTRFLLNKYPGHVPINAFQQSLLAAGSALAALTNTYRHDMVAVLSETTAGPFLARLRNRMKETRSGRQILRDRPRITSTSVDLDRLRSLPEGTLGKTYVDWLAANKVSPDTRDPVRYVQRDEELAYIMQRFRESHDFYHVLIGPFGVSLPAEIVVKWFELANFGLPVAALSGVGGPIRMALAGARSKGSAWDHQDSSNVPKAMTGPDELKRLWDTYGTWALRNGSQATCLIGVYWENEWEKDLKQLRSEYNLLEPPMEWKEWRRIGKEIRRRQRAAQAAQDDLDAV